MSSSFHLYSALGNYLGPASTDRTYQCLVREIRNTKTFSTRHVEVVQTKDDGTKRLCLFLTADFQIAESATLMTYSRSPKTDSYWNFEDSITTDQNRQNMLEQGLADPRSVQMHKVIFGLADRLLDRRHCPEGVITQTMTGFTAPGTPTTQDHLPLTSRTSGDWFKTKHAVKTEAEHVSALAFTMDAALSFVPLNHSGRSLAEAGAQSSLDFALRVFGNAVDVNEWCMREMTTVAGGDGRTYSEAKVWERGGRMVAEMSQQCILRPKKGAKI